MTAVSHPDARKWNHKFRQAGQSWLDNGPHPFLLEVVSTLPKDGLALDAAAGVGLNGLFLAKRGLQVIALDISEVGLRLAQQQARAQKLNMDTAVVDLSNIWLPANQFDVILNFRFLERATFSQYKRSLKPGGWLVFETFLRRETASTHPQYYLRPGELRLAFADFEINHYLETTGRQKNVAQLLAQKPHSEKL